MRNIFRLKPPPGKEDPSPGVAFSSKDFRLSLAICIISVALFAFLYGLRLIDDNRLTSWRLVFQHVELGGVFLLVAAGALAAFCLAVFASRHNPLSPKPLFFISFAMCAAFWGEPEVIIDSSRYFTQAKHLSTYGMGYFIAEWGREIAAWTDLPFFPFVYGLAFKVFGESRIFIQLLNSAMFSLTVVLASMLERELLGNEDGPCLGGAMLLAMPCLYVQVPLMMVDVPAMFLFTLACHAFWRALDGGGVLVESAAAFSIACMALSKYSLWAMASVFAVMVPFQLRTDPRGKAGRLARMLLMISALLAPVAVGYHDVLREQLHILVSFQKPALKGWGESYASTFLFQIHPFVTIGALYAAYRAAMRKDLRAVIVFWPVLLMLALGGERSRYLIPVFPMFAIMASYGVRDVGGGRPRAAVAYAALIASFMIAWSAFLPFLKKDSYSNLYEAGRMLDGLQARDVQVVTAPQESSVNPAVSVPLLDIYTDRDIRYCYKFNPGLEAEDFRMSPFRFSWAYRNPPYYEEGCSEGAAPRDVIVLIHSRDKDDNYRIKGYELIGTFKKDLGIYRFKTLVNIYRKI